jgi:FHS family L-fucose permease-like MFS transporter
MSAKFIVIFAFCLSSMGSFVFTLSPGYPTFLTSLFIMGSGVAMLQVALWPLLRTGVGEENYSFSSVLAQMFFGATAFLSPLAYIYLVLNMSGNGDGDLLITNLEKLTPSSMSWVAMYIIFGVICLAMVFVISLIKFLKLELKSDDKVGGLDIKIQLLKNH